MPLNKEPKSDKLLCQSNLDSGMAQVLRLIEAGEVPQNVLGVSEDWMKERYATGYTLFSEQRFDEAAEVFSYLAALNPVVKIYWFSLATAQLRAGSWEMALTSLAMTSILDPHDPEPHYYAGLCNVSLERIEQARSNFELVIKLSEHQQQYAHLAQEAASWLEDLA